MGDLSLVGIGCRHLYKDTFYNAILLYGFNVKFKLASTRLMKYSAMNFLYVSNRSVAFKNFNRFFIMQIVSL